MSATKIGEIAPFQPLPGQPFPPARNHPRWKELYRLHDEWIMKYWPFSSEKKRARIPFMNLAGFSTWCAPAADFDRMVWGARISGIFFLADDYIDSGKMLDRIPGFKQAATGTGPMHPEDRAELCHDIVFRAIKATSHPRTFDQLTKCTHEWWDSNIHEPFKNLDQYLATRRVNIAMYFANSYFRYTLNLNLTDEQINHPLMREAEGIVSDHVGLVNDYFSYAKEKLTNSDDTNIIRILQDHEGLSYEQAQKVIENKIRQKERDFIPAGMAVLEHPELGKDPEVRRWIACLPYCMGGNNAWSQSSGRYNIGDVPGGVPFPKLSFEAEPTPEADIVNDAEESRIRDLTFNVEHIPEPELTIDVDAIESGSQKTATKSSIIVSNLLDVPQKPRPENVGISAIEIYSRKLDAQGAERNGACSATFAASSLLTKYAVEPNRIGRVDVSLTTSSGSSRAITASIVNMLRSAGNPDVEGIVSPNSSYASVTSFVSAVSWIESSSWDGRYAMVIVGNYETNVAVLVGPDAPIVLEPYRGFSLKIGDQRSSTVPASVSSALQDAFSVYQRKRDAWISRSGLSVSSETDPAATFFAFDYMIYDGAEEGILQGAHAELYAKSHQALKLKNISLASKDQDRRGGITSPILQHREQGSPLTRLAFLIHTVPSYDLFEKRIALFAYGGGEGSSYLSLRVKGDTKYIRDTRNL
ncbi:hypothetical protein M413DRAFT_32419 [Hebeloma cylindrosporum]|uniref:Terpene synthase n=1 Tax=Hebeloma cylindrosporum TaxID=76867 RepID=A0A0C2Y398_HEBCY|nr:hypothetical protein M413DRAFT_32419 [Hebeloma cylindrosporum h7]